MSAVIGLEYEFFSEYDQYDIEDHMVSIFGMKLGCEIDITGDSSLRRTKESKGMYGHEIITPPLKKNDALKLMTSMNQYLRNIDAKFNKSTGFHINVSTPNMDKVDPRLIIACSDDYFIAKYFNRHKNTYCRTWKENVNILNEETVNSKSNIRKEFDNLVSCFFNDKITSNVVRRAYTRVDPKYSSINIGKLKEQKYIEYRMVGGPNYIDCEDEIVSSIDHFIEGQSKAKNPKNQFKIGQYLEWALL